MIALMQCTNEEEYVERVLDNIGGVFDRIIVIDGGSTDYTREELKKRGCEVYLHPWLDWYHDMNSMQRNIGLSYIPHGESFYMHDFDERLSEELAKFLREDATDFMEENDYDLVHVHRRTVEVVRYPDSPHAVIGDDGWPIESHQIGQYPDPQPRLIRRRPGMFWGNSPHHVLYGVTHENVIQPLDIIHYEKNDSRHRFRIERKWAREQATRIRLGLTPDEFETRLKPEVAEYGDPEAWYDNES